MVRFSKTYNRAMPEQTVAAQIRYCRIGHLISTLQQVLKTLNELVQILGQVR